MNDRAREYGESKSLLEIHRADFARPDLLVDFSRRVELHVVTLWWKLKLKLKARDWGVIRSGHCRNDSIMLGWQARGARVMAVVTSCREARSRCEIIPLMCQGCERSRLGPVEVR